MFEQLNNLPQKVKCLDQFILWKSVQLPNGNYTKVPYDAKTGRKADVTNPAHRSSFDFVMRALQTGMWAGAGFVFTKGDGLAGVDLDVKEGVEPTQLQQFILKKLDSYTELSPSGRGVHIIVEGEVPKGRNNSELGVEIYSDSRFFTVTGDNINDSDVMNRAQMLLELWHEVGGVFDGDGKDVVHDVVNPALIDDATLVKRICASGTNKAYFNWTASFNWSEAYRSVLGAACLFSSDQQQIKRVIMAAGIVTNAPAHGNETRQARVERLWATEYNFACRQGDLERADSSYRIWSTKWFPGGSRELYTHEMGLAGEAIRVMLELHYANVLEDAQNAAVTARRATLGVTGAGMLPVPLHKAGLASDDDLEQQPPTGMFAQILNEIMRRSRNPSQTMATWSLLGFVSGAIGRAYITEDGAGVNNFFILSAVSNTGKTQHWGALTSMVRQSAPEMLKNIFGGEASSPQIIAKEGQHKPSMVLRLPDAGTWLKGVVAGHTSIQMQLRSSLLDIYESAGAHEAWHIPKSIRAKEDKNDTIDEFNMSIVLDTTPQYVTDFELSNFTEGLMSRFIIISGGEEIAPLQEPFRGDCPQEIQNTFDTLYKLFQHHSRPNTAAAMGDYGIPNRLVVRNAEGVKEYMWQLEIEINDTIIQVQRHNLPPHYIAASRVVLNAKRVAAIIAMIENPAEPVITKAIFDWALQYVLSSVTSVIRQFTSGVMGSMESKQEAAIINFIERQITKNPNRPYVTLSQIGQNVDRQACFTQSKMGARQTRQRVLADMFERGVLVKNVVQGPTKPITAIMFATDE